MIELFHKIEESGVVNSPAILTYKDMIQTPAFFKVRNAGEILNVGNILNLHAAFEAAIITCTATGEG